jgi:hypothetical protein
MAEAFKYVIDAVAGVTLFMAILLVFAVDWFFFSTAAPAENTLHNVKVIGGERRQGDQKKLKLAVTPSGKTPKAGFKGFDLWDDMGKLLNELGDGYSHEDITEDTLIRKHQEKKLNEYDVIFLTCSGGADNDKLREPLQSYVANGGILYASDWRYDAIAKAFPDMVVPNLRGDGANQTLAADVVDPALREALDANKIELKFDLPEWKTAAFGGPRVKKLLQGKYLKDKTRDNPVYATAPLMVKFQFDKGTVIFTSFHNEKQNSRTEKQLLQYLVFSLVTAGVDAEVNTSLDKEGFTPQRSNLLSTPKNQSKSKDYDNEHEGVLRFVLGFRNEGAKLRFNIKSPTGKQFTKDCESTTILEVSNAAKGTWTYTVTALDAYENFPFTMTVAQKK